MAKRKDLIVVEQIEEAIFEIRGHRVMVDAELAALYGVATKRLNEQVKRNVERFPQDFAFQLSSQEFRNLKSQFATSKTWQAKRVPPYVYTEHGALMAANVLNSASAVAMSVRVVRAFIKAREFLEQSKDFARQLKQLEDRIAKRFSEQDEKIHIAFRAIEQLIEPTDTKKRRIGFEASSRRKGKA